MVGALCARARPGTLPEESFRCQGDCGHEGLLMKSKHLIAGLLALGFMAGGCGDNTKHPSSQPITKSSPAHLIEVDLSASTAVVYVLSNRENTYRTRAVFKIASGQTAFPTPTGAFFIASEIRNPSWTAPNRSWVPSQWRGQTFGPNDPRNPLTGAWLGLSGCPGRSSCGVGFHGTRATSSLGTRASHGCLRMTTAGAVRLSRIVDVGTPVVIHE